MGDYRTTPGEKAPLTGRQKSRRRRRAVLVASGVLLILLAAGSLWDVNRYVPAAGYVTSEDYAEIRPPAAATVLEIKARTGDRVSAGQVLVRFDDAREQADWREAESRVLQTEAEIARRETEIAERRRQRREETVMAEMRWTNAKERLRRMEELLAGGLVSEAQVHDQRLHAELARIAWNLLREADESLYEKELEVLRQEAAARREAAGRARARLQERSLRAPLAGELLRYHFVPGEVVRPENVLFEIFGGERQILRLRIAERHAVRVAPGLACEIVLSSHRGFPRQVFHGQVVSLRNVVQSEGDRTYRVAFCSFDTVSHDIPMGTTAEARILYGRGSLWAFLLGWD